MRDRSRAFGGSRFRNILGRDVDAPLLVSATINPAGTTLTLQFSEPTAGHSGFAYSNSSIAGAQTITYVSGDGTSTKVFSIVGAAAHLADTCTLTYTAGDVVDLSGNALANLGSTSITNNSTDPYPTLTSATVAANGTTVTLVFTEAVSGSGAGFTLTNGGSVALTYGSGSGTATLVFTAASTVHIGDTPTLNYSGGNMADATGGPLATISGHSVTNNSTQVAGGSFEQTTAGSGTFTATYAGVHKFTLAAGGGGGDPSFVGATPFDGTGTGGGGGEWGWELTTLQLGEQVSYRCGAGGVAGAAGQSSYYQCQFARSNAQRTVQPGQPGGSFTGGSGGGQPLGELDNSNHGGNGGGLTNITALNGGGGGGAGGATGAGGNGGGSGEASPGSGGAGGAGGGGAGGNGGSSAGAHAQNGSAPGAGGGGAGDISLGSTAGSGAVGYFKIEWPA